MRAIRTNFVWGWEELQSSQRNSNIPCGASHGPPGVSWSSAKATMRSHEQTVNWRLHPIPIVQGSWS